jgi:M6 family metalloprotease-like protein
VSDWYTPSISAVELSNNSGLLNSRLTLPALQWYKETYNTTGQEFDSDQDGYIDAVYFIYSVEFDPRDEALGEQKDVFWAFVSYIGGLANVASPTMFHYGWSSYRFLYNDGVVLRSDNGKFLFDENSKPRLEPYRDADGRLDVNAHVLIHEFGHLFGLEDYYSYDRSKGDWGALGALDMMDFNVGDHHPFSKSVLGWTYPTVITDTTTFTLSPFQEKGQFVLLTPTYQDTMLDEYLLIEFYTPTGLQAKDASEAYAGRYPRQFSIPGIKVTHVDARVGEYMLMDGRWQFTRYVTEAPQRTGIRYDLAHSNTASRSLNPHFKLLHLLESSGQNTFINGGYATDATLFVEGDKLDNYTFNSGQTLGFTFEVVAIFETEATIRVTRI